MEFRIFFYKNQISGNGSYWKRHTFYRENNHFNKSKKYIYNNKHGKNVSLFCNLYNYKCKIHKKN